MSDTLTIILAATVVLVLFVVLGKSCYEHFASAGELSAAANKVQGLIKIERFYANTYSDSDLSKMIRVAKEVDRKKLNITEFEKRSGFVLEPLAYARMMEFLRKDQLDVKKLREIILSNGMLSQGLKV